MLRLTKGIIAFASSLEPALISDQQQDALALLSNSNYELSAFRKELIEPELNAQFSHLCKLANPVTKNLFW